MSGSARKRKPVNMATDRERVNDRETENEDREHEGLVNDQFRDEPRESVLSSVLQLFLSLLCGIWFGIALEKGRGKSVIYDFIITHF